MARTQGSFSDVTGPRIQDAALRLFARHGYAAVSMRQIASEVGVQAGALYNYTPDKQALLVGLLQGHMDDLLGALAQEDVPTDPCAALRHFVRFHIGFHIVRRDAVFIAYMELRNLTPENFTTIEGLRRTYEDHLESILRAGHAAGSFDVADTKVTTLAIIAMLTEITTWYSPEGRLSVDEVTQQYVDFTCRMVRAS